MRCEDGWEREWGRFLPHRGRSSPPHSAAERPVLIALPAFLANARRLRSSQATLAAASAMLARAVVRGRDLDDVRAGEVDPPSARRKASASAVVSPPTSGVPVPGANAGSRKSTSNVRNTGRCPARARTRLAKLRARACAAGRRQEGEAERARRGEVLGAVERAAQAGLHRRRGSISPSSTARRNVVPWK